MNKFIYTIDNKRYHTLNYYYLKKYGFKVFKIPLDAGFSCPNIDKGAPCIYCDKTGSSAFPEIKNEDLLTQFSYGVKVMTKKWTGKYIGYFQAHSNTYAPLAILKEKYELILQQDNVIGLSIATRCDAITEDVYSYLSELNKNCDLTIELGLQSINENTTNLIQRGHSLKQFEEAVFKFKTAGIKVVVHIINGLPYEKKTDMLKTIIYLNQLKIDGIKIHMLFLERGTLISKLFEERHLKLLTKDEYIDIVISQLEILDPEIVIHRITGDPNKENLIAPTWLLKKTILLNDIDKEMANRDTWQGKYYKKTNFCLVFLR